MASSDVGTSSGNASGGQYQVFLSFHGRDTRDGFTSFLHGDLRKNGVHAFMDDEELRVGEEIGEALRRAIDDSQIYIPIFSKNYASSKWCLRELAMMVDSTSKSEKKKILPFFYDVKPDDVDLKTPLYKTAMEEHKEKFPDEEKSWEDALKKVDKIKGWELQEFKNQAKLVDSVVKEVLHRLKIRYKFVTEDLVGLYNRVAEVLEFLDVNCSDKARLLGLYGMGGIGKTTLARVIYNGLNSHFGKCYAFLDDVRETSKKVGLLPLQEKLLTEIDSSSAAGNIYDVDCGRERIEATLGSKKVLIVLDDVDEKKQIDNLIGQDRLHPGTRIIITTRNASILKMIEQRMAPEKKEVNSDHAIQILRYEMQVLNPDHALQLFKRHAFHGRSVAKDFDSLSIDIVKTTGGLPLALEVIGSLLYDKGEAIWRDTLRKLKEIPHEEVQKQLMISYDALNDCQREIFLDVACFFIGDTMTNAIYMWTDCQFYPNLEINILVSMSLIRIWDNRFWMHDQLRDLGRDIVRREDLKDLGKRSRLWTTEDILDLVETEESKEKVVALDLHDWSSKEKVEALALHDWSKKDEALDLRNWRGKNNLRSLKVEALDLHDWSDKEHVDPREFKALVTDDALERLGWNLKDVQERSSPISISHEEMGRFKNLRFLRLSNGTLHGDFIVSLPKLRWLSWRSPLPNFSVPHLHSKKLVVLELLNNHFTDDSKVWDLIKMATKLKNLTLVKCHGITRTPALSKCLDLERLSFHRCGSLMEIDSSIGELKSLLGLSITFCPLIKRVPDEIGGLVKLERFSLLGCDGLSELPTSVGDLASLRKLNLSYTGITSLPESIGKLRCLSFLNLQGSQITEIPGEIEGLVELQHFRMGNKVIKHLPDSIGKLTSLRTLNLSTLSQLESNSNRWELPKAIGKLEKLEELHLHFRNELEGKIPDKIGNLSSLRVLDLGLTRICQVPRTIIMLSRLSILDLSKCDEIKQLPELPANLVKLHVGSSSLQVVPNLSKLTNLEDLSLSDSSALSYSSEHRDPSNPKHKCDLGWVGRLSKLERLSLYFVKFTAPAPELGLLSLLEHLTLRGLDLQPLKQLPLSLLYLSLGNFSSTGSPLSNLKVLSDLWLYDSQLQEIQLSGLSQLQQLHLSSCGLRSLSIPSSLWRLWVYRCPNMFEIQFPGMSASLRELTIHSCGSIGRIVLGGEGGSLGVPDQSESSSIESTDCSPGVLLLTNAFKKLEEIELWNCENLLEIQVIGTLSSLQYIQIYSCNAMEKLSGISNLKNLHRLNISKCSKLRVVEGLNELEFLTRLDVDKCSLLGTWFDILNSKIPDECVISDHRCCESHGYLLRRCSNFKECKEIAKMELDAVESDTELQPQFHPSASSQDHEINEKPSMDDVREGTPPGNQSARSMEKMGDEAGQRSVDMETSDRNYAIAAVQNVVGIDDCAKQIIDLLEMDVNDEVRIIGIYGTDGIGKTTLAKAVYKRISSIFDSCSFLVEVEETTQNSRGIQILQQKLICDILERDHEDLSFDERIEDFLNIFRGMKVLIVVDDVEKPSDLHVIVGDQLHWFGPGTRIIVTSKNSGILKEYHIEKACNYMVSELDDGQAFELFCKHAFRMQSSIPDYDRLSSGIVSATEKLPLAVEIIGSFLRGRSIQEWEKMEKSMQARMMKSQKITVGLEEILDICYQELDEQQKDIFLDIACFISGVDARIASYMWPNCYPSSGWILMPLANIGENNELHMHRLLRCLGKRVFKQEESQGPYPSRFCTQDMVLSAMKREKGMKNVEARDSCILTAANFASMPAMSFLKLDDAKVSGDFAGAFRSLRWLCWQRCPLDFGAINFVLKKLVILDLSWSKITEDWRGWSEIKMEELKVLNLTGCSALLITPAFSGYKKLEMLILERCSRLMKLDPSIGHLKRLVSLNLKFCSRLNRLPVELGCTTALKELFIDGTSVREIPISIGNLKRLEILSGFKCSPLTHLPSSISCLTALTVLSLDGAKISELPSSLGELFNLRRLSLRDCRYMQQLPDSIGKMGNSLEELDISATSISELPDSIRDLQNLRVLRMDSSFVRAFPEEIGNLTKLEEIHSSWCRHLKGAIPRDIKRLHHLRSLTLRRSSISSLPSEISTISSLHTLDLLQCNEIEVFPELPPSLICLRVSSKRMKAIPLLKDLKELEELYLSDGELAKCQPPSKQLIPESRVKQLSIWFSRLWNLELLRSQRIFLISFPKLRKLELSLSRIIKLQFVYEPTDIPQLKTLTLSGLSLEEVSELPETLSVLSIRGCSSLKRLPIVQCLTNISAFELYDSAIEDIEGLEGLEALKRLYISNCNIQNLNGIGQLGSLRSLILSDCDDLSLPDLSNLKSLKILEIRRCKMIHQIKGLEKLSLEKLNISECPAEDSVQVENLMARLMVP